MRRARSASPASDCSSSPPAGSSCADTAPGVSTVDFFTRGSTIKVKTIVHCYKICFKFQSLLVIGTICALTIHNIYKVMTNRFTNSS